MRKVVLKDGTTITGCTDASTSNAVFIVRDTFALAGAELDKVTPANASQIKVYDEEDKLVDSAVDLVFSGYGEMTKDSTGVTVSFNTRMKSDMEKMQDEIAELQEAVIG